MNSSLCWSLIENIQIDDCVLGKTMVHIFGYTNQGHSIYIQCDKKRVTILSDEEKETEPYAIAGGNNQNYRMIVMKTERIIDKLVAYERCAGTQEINLLTHNLQIR